MTAGLIISLQNLTTTSHNDINLGSITPVSIAKNFCKHHLHI